MKGRYAKRPTWSESRSERRELAKQRAADLRKEIDAICADTTLSKKERTEIRERVRSGLHPLRGSGL